VCLCRTVCYRFTKILKTITQSVAHWENSIVRRHDYFRLNITVNHWIKNVWLPVFPGQCGHSGRVYRECPKVVGALTLMMVRHICDKLWHWAVAAAADDDWPPNSKLLSTLSLVHIVRTELNWLNKSTQLNRALIGRAHSPASRHIDVLRTVLITYNIT